MKTKSQTRITYENGTDWGCDYEEADADRWVARLSRALEAAYPGAEIAVSMGDATATSIRAYRGGIDIEDEVQEIADSQWAEFCESNYDEEG